MGTQSRRRISAWVSRGDKGAVRGYAEATKAQCVGTQSDGGSGAYAQKKYAAR